MRNFAALVTFCAALALPSAAQAAGLVVNGDFEAGNGGFDSDYSYVDPLGTNTTEGQYTVRTNPWPWNGAFFSMGDHTSGSGQMMVINGSPNVGDLVWQSGSIDIATGTNYFFEAFVANVCCSGGGINPPFLTFSVSLDDGAETALVQLGVPGDPVGNWIGLSSQFNSGSATKARLSLFNANTIREGNDFAIDDINLDTRSIVVVDGGVPEPATWAMMLMGFGAIGAALRKRKTNAGRRLRVA